MAAQDSEACTGEGQPGMKMTTGRMTVLVACILLTGPAAGAQQAGAAADRAAGAGKAPGVVVLDTLSTWRMHSQLAPPMLETGEAVPFSCRWMSYETPAAPPDWAKPDYDDRFWHRGPLTLVPKTALLARTSLRGKFAVTDLAAVEELRLSAAYNGGIVVYLNGKEVHREHLAAGAQLADAPGGEERKIADWEVPVAALRQGMNVIGLEIVRGPYPKEGAETGQDVYNVNTCEIKQVALKASAAAGLVPNTGRPEGLQVWPADPLALDMNLDYGDRAEPLRPVTILAARNGMFSGKAVVGSPRPIRGLKATPGELVGEGGRIRAEAVRIRYGIQWSQQQPRELTRLNQLHPYIRYEAAQFNALSPEPPEEVPVIPLRTAWYRDQKLPEAVTPVPGAVVPVWVSVKVPASVKAGTYTGSVKVEAQGETPVGVPVEVRVADWSLPDTQDFRTWVDIIQCLDTLALEYGVPLWSDKHFEMIANSFKLIGETGSRTVYIPLIAHTNLGNEEGMVRWIEKGDRYDYDFSIMERYLDVAEKSMGKPKLLVLLVWDVYMLPKSSLQNPHGIAFRVRSHLEHLQKIGAEYGLGPMVTVASAGADGNVTTEPVIMPSHLDAAASRPLWQPLFDELRERLRKLGMDKIAMLGLFHDTWATKQEVEFFREITGGMPWAMHSHGGPAEGALMYGIAPIGYQAVVWDVRFSDDGADTHGKGKGFIESFHGWNRKVLWSQFDRFSRESHPCTRWRHQAEVCITGAQRGPGRLGAEYWMVLRDNRGRRVGRSYERYPESSWRNLIIPEALMAPGPSGAVATNQMEALREGLQECEAIIVIEQALMDEGLKAQLGPDLAKRCEECLRARHMMLWLSLSNLQFYYTMPGSKNSWETTCLARNWRNHPNLTGHNWFLSSGYQERTAELFTLAGEVSRKLGRQ